MSEESATLTASTEELASYICSLGNDETCTSQSAYGAGSCCFYSMVTEVPDNLTEE